MKLFFVLLFTVACNFYFEAATKETLEIFDHPFGIGVQWHPEKMIDYDLNSKLLFNKFIDETYKYKKHKIK